MVTPEATSSALRLGAEQSPDLRRAFTAGMAQTAAAVTVVTTDGLAGRFGQTVTAATSVTADPPTLLMCLYRSTVAAEAVLANGCFAVNTLGAEQQGISNIFAGRAPIGERYVFDGHWRTGRTGCPIHPEAPATFECLLRHTVSVSTHVICVGEVVAVTTAEADGLTYRGRGYGRHIPEPLIHSGVEQS